MTIFGGKGGVGKTTAAAAFSLALAEAEPLRRVLVFSTDPAHSLSDSFDEPVGQLKSHVAGLKNLDAVEVDPKRWFDSFRERYRTWIDELFSSFSAGSAFDIKFDREAMQSLMELTPPGIDEIAALGTMSDLLQTDQYDTIILDTAPTGHLIRLLELPQIALAWVRTFMKLLLKYQNIVRANQFAEELVSLSRSMKNLLSIMTNPAACEFVGVTIAENMALEETLDMVRSLKRLNIPVRRILINNLVSEQAAQACDFCEARRRSQQKSISEFRPEFVKSLNIFVAVQQPAEVHGKQDLIRHFSTWTHLPVRKLRQRPKLAKNRRARRSAK
jgi:arsenite-transporting ATPase